MEEAKENVSHLYPCAIALPMAVLRFPSLSPLEGRFFEVGDYGLSIILPLKNSECSARFCISILLESCSRAAVNWVWHSH